MVLCKYWATDSIYRMDTRKVEEYLLSETTMSTNILVLASQLLFNVFHILGAFYLNHSIYFRLTPH